MKWLEAMDLDRDILPDLKKNEKMQTEIFKHARKLALYPENRETLRLCELFVKNTADMLEELIIHTNFPETTDPRDLSPHGDHIETRTLNDSATAPGLLTSTVFSHMTPFEKCEPFKNMKSLRLHKVSLRYCTDTWCKIIDFTNVEELRIYQCGGADSFFGQLSRSISLPRKLKVLEFQHRDNSENEALLALDGFLCLVSGIRELVIDLEHVKSLPAAAGIARHSKTLRLLNAHCSLDSSVSPSITGPSDEEELVWDSEDFEKICKACTGLEQLSCAWPQTSLIRTPSEEWKAFERACSSLKDMMTLHISTWPTNKPSTQLLPRVIYEQLLQCLAQRGFETVASSDARVRSESDTNGDASAPTASTDSALRPSKLHLIAFGISDKIYEREDSKNQIVYLRSTCKDAEGKSKVYAAPVGWCVRQYVEPCSDVLDFVLHREAHPPCREVRNGGGMGWGGEDDDDFVDV
ncbi:hypothetical protein LTR37_001078 [Vermiconidia calcicola]|uniref:Uncharacterized protein n=1 Tax=Vermiconidia calcicola TaxID=1690605 RepID=A0ACC3NX08_9PEZI|nr:hypothetical protein LTR37_001078 [Vermiconidia calcicola]